MCEYMEPICSRIRWVVQNTWMRFQFVSTHDTWADRLTRRCCVLLCEMCCHLQCLRMKILWLRRSMHLFYALALAHLSLRVPTNTLEIWYSRTLICHILNSNHINTFTYVSLGTWCIFSCIWPCSLAGLFCSWICLSACVRGWLQCYRFSRNIA